MNSFYTEKEMMANAAVMEMLSHPANLFPSLTCWIPSPYLIFSPSL